MGLRSEFFFEELIYDERLKEAYEMFDSYINFRFDYMFRASINIAPSEPIRNVDCEYKLYLLYYMNIFIDYTNKIYSSLFF